MNRKNFNVFVAILLSISFVLAGCSSTTKENATSKDKSGDTNKPDTFIYGIDGDPGNAVNVITTGDRYGLMEIKTLFSPLYMYNGKDDIKYFLAESMTPSEDFLTYTAKLRKDVKWHDGQAFTADDVVFTYNEMLKEENGGWARSQLVFNNQPVKVEKVDDYTVKFTLPTVSMGGMEALGNIFIMPKHVYDGETNIANSPKNATPVGTGPYKFKEYKAGESVTFEKNDDYFLGAPKISKVVYRIIMDANTATMALQKGEINALAIQPSDSSKFKDSKNVTLKPYDEGRIGYLAFNLSSKAVQAKEVRQAIAFGLNRDEINTASYISTDYSTPAYSFLPKKATYFTDKVEKHKFDTKKSKDLLSKAGASDLKLKLAFIANNPIQQKQAAVIQQNLKAAGISVELVGMDGTALSKKMQSEHSDFDMYLGGYIMGIDPDTFNSLFVTNGEANYMHYSNPRVDELFNQGRVEKDDAKRKAIYEEIQKLIIEDAAFYPLTENKRILAIDSRIKGIDEAALVPVYTFEDMSKLSY
ncbi:MULTISPECIES: ABC transporter substrate-binding protein [unclassified Bacillus (in: firmicutes)]|uniref:ABC transporter substrate-binding protein n=1 Tax=unclassified Bacillus (in: firmicutes) TaxID=185979 RepID=UPI0008E015B6|nr:MULTISPECIES: ABC transporter substrate-binding protein [unclassified Bacillus (in: firmicutes)]SFB09279.1 peptide/nickel transport system substrate-binding protein [Bacillus sp. UNCCL13]SFQ86780.1 peptide/nickel transport system substrate-binding protein [Bacillus sp. cl95]